jgi:hypothetical protein
MFVIQSLPRCGTHLVRTSLQSHGDIVCFGEVFNPSSREHGFTVARPTVAEVIDHCRARSTPAGFVAHAFVGLEPTETGPSLDQGYRRRPEVRAAQGLWHAIPPNTPVITLRRKNLLARYVSELVAHQRNRWLVRVGEKVPFPVQVAICREHMLEDFARTEALMEIARRRLPSALGIRYEDLVTDQSAAFDQILAHLGLAPRPLIPGTVKVGRPLVESIRNFGEVRAWLADTRFEAFLEMPI